MKNQILIAACALALAAPPAAAQTERTLAAGVYTDQQAARGEALMNRVCIECHEPSEFDEIFLDSWRGTDVAELYDLIFSTMPEDNPGSLTPLEYADALAYIFRLNGIPTGQEELKPDMALMRAIIIER